MMRRASIIFVLTLLASCSPEDLFDLPTSPARITVLAMNEVGRPWNVILSPSTSAARAFHPTGIPGAVVKIYEDGNLVEQLKYKEPTSMYDAPDVMPSLYYSDNNSPRVGHEYMITVDADGYPSVSSTYRQPDPVQADITFELREAKPTVYTPHFSDNTHSWFEYDTVMVWTFDLSITFTDPPGKNYYEFWIQSATTQDSLDFDGGYFPQIENQQPPDNPLDEGGMIDDKDISEKKVTFKFIYKFDNYYSKAFEPKPRLPNWFRVSLKSMSEDMYKFIVTSRKSQVLENDPYAQPVTTVTNIQNGLGVFGAYTPYSKDFYYKPEEN